MTHLIKNKQTVKVAVAALAVFAFLLAACTGNSNGFTIEGRLLSMNQADFLVYSPDGAISGIDTIHAAGGRFVYERAIASEGTVVIVFPNFATLPVFVKPGASISIDGNAAHLKETKVKGTDDNEEFTKWRSETGSLPDRELPKKAEQFIREHPQMTAAMWLLRQYFMLTETPDTKKCRELLGIIKQARGNDTQATRLAADMAKLSQLKVGDRLPRFSARDIKGEVVSSGQFTDGTAVILVWATWNYESLNVLRQLASNQKFGADSLRINHILTLSVDPDTATCGRTLRQCNAEALTNVCDGKMLESPLLQTLGIKGVPDDLKMKDGKIVAVSLPYSALMRK